MNDKANYVHAASLAEVEAAGCTVVQLDGYTVALFAHDGQVHAVDNRCPHMGFPLDRGTVREGILTCHWHHARFDLESGGTFDQWADDVRVFPVDVRDGQVWVELSRRGDPRQHQRERLLVGLERNLSLVMAKSVLVLREGQGDPAEPFRAGLLFGTQYRRAGWRMGLTMHACLMNLLPILDEADRPRALYHGLSAVAQDSFGQPPRFPVRPLPTETADINTLKGWFRQFVEVRDAEGAERCIISAVRAGANDKQMADMLFAAATDHRYIDIGHPVDFTNKAFEALDVAGWEHAEQVLTSLVRGYAVADRMEESNAWRHPVDLVRILEAAFEQLPDALDKGRAVRAEGEAWSGAEEVLPLLHGDDPQAIADGLLSALGVGASEVDLAVTVSHAAALRIVRFHTSNEFSDWDTALHTFTFANAVEGGLRRAPSPELVRGVFDAAMSVYLDRFLNIPAARLPEPVDDGRGEDELLDALDALLDRQQQVSQAGQIVAQYLHSGGRPERLLARLGRLLLREDRDFHTIQTVEGAISQYRRRASEARLRGKTSLQGAAAHMLVAAARYLAAHSPTVRAQGQTYEIAQRLHRGEHLFEES
ncbi:MAG TPA: Rieske (2Fe-2S) protein [Anaerolineae bacterium]|nr:Rieske (2Fe-2S) protein [Anaerolineae bacterium]